MRQQGNRDQAGGHGTLQGNPGDKAGRNFFRSNYAWKKRRKSPINTRQQRPHAIYTGLKNHTRAGAPGQRQQKNAQLAIIAPLYLEEPP
jgi:hypothetical protein